MAIVRDEFLNSMYPLEYLETLPKLEEKLNREYILKIGMWRMLMNSGRFRGNVKGVVERWDIEENDGGALDTWGHNTPIEADDPDELLTLEMPWSTYYKAIHFSELDKEMNSGPQQLRNTMRRKQRKMNKTYKQRLAKECWDGDGAANGKGFRNLQGVRTFMKSSGTSGLSYPAGSNGASLDNTVGHQPVILDGDGGAGSSFTADATERLLTAQRTATRTTDEGECSPTHGFASRSGIGYLTNHIISQSTMFVNVTQTKSSDRFKFGFTGGFEFNGMMVEHDEHLGAKEIFMFSPETWDLESLYDKPVKNLIKAIHENVGDDVVEAYKSVIRMKCRKLGCQALVYWA